MPQAAPAFDHTGCSAGAISLAAVPNRQRRQFGFQLPGANARQSKHELVCVIIGNHANLHLLVGSHDHVRCARKQSFHSCGPIAAGKTHAVLQKVFLVVRQHDTDLSARLQHGLEKKNVRTARRRRIAESDLEFFHAVPNLFGNHFFELFRKARRAARRMIEHVSREDGDIGDFQPPFDAGRVRVSILQDEPRVATAGMNVTEPAARRFRSFAIPIFRLRSVFQNQSRFTERGKQPIGIVGRTLEFSETLLANLFRKFLRAGLITNGQRHGCRVNPAPITTRQFVGLFVNLRRTSKVHLLRSRFSRARGEILVRPREHSQGFFIDISFGAKLGKNVVRSLRGAAARKSESQKLSQPNVRLTAEQTFGHDIKSQKRLAQLENALTQPAIKFRVPRPLLRIACPPARQQFGQICGWCRLQELHHGAGVACGTRCRWRETFPTSHDILIRSGFG